MKVREKWNRWTISPKTVWTLQFWSKRRQCISDINRVNKNLRCFSGESWQIWNKSVYTLSFGNLRVFIHTLLVLPWWKSCFIKQFKSWKQIWQHFFHGTTVGVLEANIFSSEFLIDILHKNYYLNNEMQICRSSRSSFKWIFMRSSLLK